MRSFFDVPKGIETVPPIIVDKPMVTIDPYDELDDFGNYNPVPPGVDPGYQFPRPPFKRGDPTEPTHRYSPPKLAPSPLPFEPPVFIQPAQPGPITPENFDAPIEPETFWDKVTPGESETPGEFLEQIKPFGSVFNLAGMLPLLLVSMLTKERE